MTVFTEGPTHQVREASAAFCRLIGQHRRDIEGRSLDSLLHVEEPGAFRGLLDRVFETGLPNLLVNAGWRDGTGDESLRYVTAMASPVVNEDTAKRGLLVQILDMTSQILALAAQQRAGRDARLANEALVVAGVREQEFAEVARQELTRWSALVENLTEGVTVLDSSGRPILVNPVGKKLLEIDDDHAMGYSACALHSLDGALVSPERHPARRALSGERFADEELVHERADGSKCRLVFSGSSVRDEGGEIVLAINVYRDVTSLRELERIREEYVALISHDLRNPLSALLMNSQLLVECLDSQDKDALTGEGRYARAIVRVTRRLTTMVDELCASSKLETETRKLRTEDVAPASLLSELQERISTPERRVRVVIVAEEGGMPRLRVDAPKIERALGNLISNAMKYSSAPSEIVVELSHTEAEVIFAVRDEGTGMSADDLPHVFEKYHRAPLTNDREGMGLGLYIARLIVEAHGGRIWAESVLGQGSTIRIALPIHSNADTGAGRHASAEHTSDARTRSMPSVRSVHRAEPTAPADVLSTASRR